jgi:hypothetical protein
MAAVSYSISRGQNGFKVSDFTRGTLAPGANDIEIRINTTDANSAPMTVKDIIIALEAFERGVLSDAILGNDWGV